jgi:hypothetical protein
VTAAGWSRVAAAGPTTTSGSGVVPVAGASTRTGRAAALVQLRAAWQYGLMAWVQLGDYEFQVDDEGDIRDVVSSQYDGGVHLFSLVALFAEEGESRDRSWMAAWDVVRAADSDPSEVPSLRSEAEQIIAARQRAPIADTVTLSELEDLLSAAKSEIAAAGHRTATSFTRSPTGHDLVFLIIGAVADGTAAIATTAGLHSALRGVQARFRVKRLAGREAEAVREVRRCASRDLAGVESWVTGKVSLDKDEGMLTVTLLHPDDLDLVEAHARWVRFQVTPMQDHLVVRRVESNRIPS